MKNVDYIVVGQGIAGTLLAFDLIDANKSVVIAVSYTHLTLPTNREV